VSVGAGGHWPGGRRDAGDEAGINTTFHLSRPRPRPGARTQLRKPGFGQFDFLPWPSGFATALPPLQVATLDPIWALLFERQRDSREAGVLVYAFLLFGLNPHLLGVWSAFLLECT
jgi:hypothetical protein